MKLFIIEKKRTTIKVVPTKTLEWHHLWCHDRTSAVNPNCRDRACPCP